MEFQDLEKATFKAISEFTRDRMCLIDEGTGNLLTSKGRLFIVTCHHVATSFFKEKRYRYVTLRHNERISKNDLELVAHIDGELDVALIETRTAIPKCPAYEVSHLEVNETFDLADFEKTNVLICGTPGDLTVDKPMGTFYTPFSYMTLPDETKFPSSDFLYCQYPVTRDMIDNQSGKRIKLPTAKGFSGAFMLKVKQFKGSKKQIWSPEIRVIAIQQSWDKKSYIKGTNVKYLMKLMQQCGAA